MNTRSTSPTCLVTVTPRRLPLLVGFLLVLAIPSMPARDWYVATDGVDAIGRGSIDQPVRTIQWLLDPYGHNVTWRSDAQPGDVIRYRGGDYPTQQLKIGIANLTIRAHDPVAEPVRLVGGTEESVAYVLQFNPPASGCRLEGIEIVGGGYYALKFEGQWDYAAIPFAQRYKLGNITVENCRIHDTGRDGIKITPGVSDITIRGCEIYNTGIRDNSNSDGIDCVNGTRILIQDCYIHHTATQGLYFKGGSRDCIVERTRFAHTGSAGVILGFYTDLDWFDTDVNPECYENLRGIVRNCIISDTGGMGIGFYGAYEAKAYNNTLINVNAANVNTAAIVFCPGAIYGNPTSYFPPNVAPVFVNNIVVLAASTQRPAAQIRVADGHSGLTGVPTIRNNRWFSASGALTFVDQRAGFTGSFDQWAAHIGETGSSTGDPLVDSTGHLLASSPCLGVGDSAAPVTNDFDGELRPQGAGLDVGADEFTGAPPATYAAWRAANFTLPDLTNDAVSGPAADPDSTGLTNLGRYAFALPARGAVSNPIFLDTAGSGDAPVLTLTFPRRTEATDLTYTLESSPDLVTWAAVPGRTYTAGSGSITAQDTVALGSTTRRFLRLRISISP